MTQAAPPSSMPTSDSARPDGQDGGLWWWLVLLAVVAGLVVAGSCLSPSADSERLRSARARVEEARRDLLALLQDAAETP